MAVQGRERNRVAEPEPVELQRLRVPRRVVDLVRDEQDGLARGAQDRRNLLVAGGYAGAGVGHEDDEVGLLHRLARVRRDRAGERRAVGDVDAAGVDQDEADAAPLADELLAVAGDAGRFVDDGGAALGQPVHERRLADVREADDRDRADERRLGRRLLLLGVRGAAQAHRGGTATAGRPAAWSSARKS